MTSSQVQYWQFLSRQCAGQEIRFPANNSWGTATVYGHVVPKPFRIDFADVVASNPSIDAHQYTDEYLDHYVSERWPYCLEGTIDFTITNGDDLETARTQILADLQMLIFTGWKTVPMFRDQFSTGRGYRRSYGAPKSTDILGQRRPDPSNFLHPTHPDEFIGPGLIEIDGYDFVWSQIIPLPGATSLAADQPRLASVIQRMRLHHNSYNELRDARNHLRGRDAGSIKAAVRSAAAGVEASLRFFCTQHSGTLPSRGLPFDEKIETALAAAGMPSYRAVSASDLDQLLYLYRARNSQHEGDYFYRDAAGNQVQVDMIRARQFTEAAERFVLWLDALA